MAALEAGRTTHAYLFSGPRGCGKTTSARILARALNCVEYPTDTPCGTCDSCEELARDGSGSLDVVEMDAASHGGVDDARELREQAGFAPVRDRFKIFIIDEAHMVTNQGFNALLKLVEEPPEHVKFIFATTEPEKVIGTIRSRTHHYPFRLVPPLELENYLAKLVNAEGVTAGHDLLSLVVRAGTGSVRDTLSVLDQIIGGSEGSVLDYDRAVALLGYTSANLLDDAVAAIAERDGAALFGVVDSVVKAGHDPRRFVEDLLQRLRDLVIISLAGDEAKDAFVSVPEDQYGRMVEQATKLGAERASQCADLTNEALTDMAGATAPRLQLELLCARLIVARPEGIAARSHVQNEPEQPSAEVAENLAKYAKPTEPQQSGQGAERGRRQESTMDPRTRPMPSMPQLSEPSARPTGPAQGGQEQDSQAQGGQAQGDQAQGDQAQPVAQSAPPAAEPSDAPAAPGSGPLDQIVAAWDSIRSDQSLSRIAVAQLEAANGPVAVEDDVLIIGFDQPGVANAFSARGAREVAQVLSNSLGLNLRVEGRSGGESTAPKASAARVAAPEKPPALREAPTLRAVPSADSADADSADVDSAQPIADSAQPDADSESAPSVDSGSNDSDGSTPDHTDSDSTDSDTTDPDSRDSEVLGSAAEYFPGPPPATFPGGQGPSTSSHDVGAPARADEPYDHRAAMMEADACAVFPDSTPSAPSAPSAQESRPSADSPSASSTSTPSASAPRPSTPSAPSAEFEDFPMPPPLEDPFEHTVKGSWAQPNHNPYPTAVVDPDDDTFDNYDEPSDNEDDSDWEGASADDPEISHSSVVGLQVVLDRFNAKVIEERMED